MIILKLALLLGFSIATLARSDGESGSYREQSIQTSKDADQLIYRLLQAARQDPEQDSAEMQDQQIRQRLASGVQLQLSLSQGQLSGIASQATRSGQSQLQLQGQKVIIRAPLQWSQLEIRYDGVDIQKQPEQSLQAQQLTMSLEDVEGMLSLELDQQSERLSLRSLQLQHQQPQKAKLSLYGSQQLIQRNPQLKQQLVSQLQEAATMALEQQIQEIVEQGSQKQSQGQQSRRQQRSLQSQQHANQLVDQLIRAAQQDPEQDSAELKDHQIQQRLPSGVELRLSLSEGQLSGITSQASISGQSQMQKKGQRIVLEAPLQWSQLQIQYDQVQIETQPYQGLQSQQLTASLENVKATLTLSVDQQSGQVSLISAQIRPQQPQQAQVKLIGAQELLQRNPELRQQIAKQLQQAAARALLLQIYKIVQESGSQGQSKQSARQQRSLQTSRDADQLIDQLLTQAQQDSTDLQDQKLQQRLSSGAQLQLSLRQGQLSGIASQASRSGQSQVQQRGQIMIKAPLKWSQLEVQYDEVDLKMQPDQYLEAQQLCASLRDVRAMLVLQMDWETRELNLQSLQVQPQQSQEPRISLLGAQELFQKNPQLERQIVNQIQRAAEKALQEQMKEIVHQNSMSQ